MLLRRVVMVLLSVLFAAALAAPSIAGADETADVTATTVAPTADASVDPTVSIDPAVAQAAQSDAVNDAANEAVAGAVAPAVPPARADVYRDVTGSRAVNAAGDTGKGAVIALIDTGVAPIPELAGTVIGQINMSAAPANGDQFGHGTFVAGIIHRTAPDAKIISIKLSGPDGTVDVSQVLAALQWVFIHKRQYGISAINLSYGTDSQQPYQVSPLNFALERAWDAGITVVAASGNLGTNGAGSVTKPGDDPLAISVGASDDQGTADPSDDTIADFSGRGPTSEGLAKPDFVAPGAHVVSLRDPGSTVDVAHPEAEVGDAEFRGSGTSFSTPMVTGAVALIQQADPSATPDQIKARLIATARPIAGATATEQGAGEIDDVAAVAASTGADPAPASELTAVETAQSNVDQSDGSGSLEGARGSGHVRVAGMDGTVKEIVGDTTWQAQAFNAAGYRAHLTTSANWNASQWMQAPNSAAAFWNQAASYFDASQWGASQWGASQWGASQWGASQWGASQWGASQWGASQWGASQWGASSWWASQWG